VKFSQELPAGSRFAARAFIAGKDARSLAREILTMSQEQFSAAFKGLPTKRARLRGLQRNAAIVLGTVGTSDDADLLTRAQMTPTRSSRDHAA